MTPANKELIPALNASFGLALPDHITPEEIKQKLSLYINELINHDFEKLVSLLYRIDVNEHKLRGILENNKGENAAGLMADLILERQLQKIESRKKSASNDPIPDDEKW